MFFSSMGGVIGLLRKFFAKKGPIEETVFLRKLPEWFEEKTKPLYDEIEQKFQDSISKIEQIKEKTQDDLEKLKNAQLKNKNIPQRAKQIMDGNRDSYIKKVDAFLMI